MSDPNASMAAAAPETVEKETYFGADLPPEAGKGGQSRSLWSDAWRELRTSKIFVISAVLIVLFLIMAFFPQVFTFGKDPYTCDLTKSRLPPSSEAWFGYDTNGCDVYTRTIYGAKASILVGVLTTVFCMLVGGFLGTHRRLLRWLDRRDPVAHHRHLLRHPPVARWHPGADLVPVGRQHDALPGSGQGGARLGDLGLDGR